MITGSAAIEQTLKVVSDSIERDIARYRIAVFAVVMVVTASIHLAGVGDTWIPTLLFAFALVYAIALRALILRFGNHRALPFVALVVDLCIAVGPFFLIQVVGTTGSQRGDMLSPSPPPQEANAAFMIYIGAPALLSIMLINTLRNNTRVSLASGFMAVAIYFGVVVRFVGFHPAQISVATILLLAGGISMIGARQARSTLESFARLELLRRYLPPEAVERVMRENPDEAMALGGRLVTVTILAADLRGFTSMSEKLKPSEVMEQLNAYHGAMIEVIDRHGGAIDKFIGDGTLVVFGLDGDEKKGAKAAVDCAAEMLVALTGHNQQRTQAGNGSLRMGIGIHTGPVIAGNLGVPGRRLEFTIIGDAVNTASRLEGETKARDVSVLVSSVTASLVTDHAKLLELAPVSLRGKGAPVGVFTLEFRS